MLPAAPSAAPRAICVPVSAPTAWEAFIDRFGVTAAAGLITAIGANCIAANAGIAPPEGVTALQMVLMLIVLGCVGVLSYRSPTR